MFLSKIKLIYLLFVVYFLTGLVVYNDYGIGIEEHFQRQNGFYWLERILSYLDIEGLKILALDKYQNIRSYDSNLPDSNIFNYYGIIFDVPLAFLEIFFKIDNSQLYFELRHLTSFFIFFIGSIFFYKILKKRFKKEIVVYTGTIFYIFTPRIFGDSFHNNKDILFLSILTIALFYLFKVLEKMSTKNIILFCLFSAIASSSRIMGVYLPVLLIIFLFLEYLKQEIFLYYFFKKTAVILFFYIFFLYLHFPYMWELNILKITDWFSVYFYNMELNILYNGAYYHIKYLPRLYLPLWISITTPLFILLLFIGGYILILKRFFQRILNITLTKKPFNDFWTSLNEKKDLFFFLV